MRVTFSGVEVPAFSHRPPSSRHSVFLERALSLEEFSLSAALRPRSKHLRPVKAQFHRRFGTAITSGSASSINSTEISAALRWLRPSSFPASIEAASAREIGSEFLRSQIQKKPDRLARRWGQCLERETGLKLFFRIDPNLHPLKYLHVLGG